MYLQAYIQQELASKRLQLHIAKIRMIMAKGHWNKYVKDRCRKLMIELPSTFNPESYMLKAISRKLNLPSDKADEATEFCLAYLFLPEALDSDAEDLFTKFLRKNKDGKGNFAGYFASYVPNSINQYMRFENKRLEDRWDEKDVQKIEQKVRNLDNKIKHEETTDTKTKEKLPFGLSGSDIDKLHSITDLVEELAYKDLKNDLIKFVKNNDHSSNQFAYKILKLKYVEPDYTGKELAELLKTTPKTISTVINKGLRKLVSEYAAMLAKKYNDRTLYRAMLTLDLISENVMANRKRIANSILSICDALEILSYRYSN